MSILSLHRPRWTAAALLRRGSHGGNATASVPTLTNNEHVLYKAVHDGSVTAVGTDVALHYRTYGGAWRRLAWIDVTAVGWSARTGSAQLRVAAPDRQTHTIEFAADRTLTAFAAERIAHLRIIARRVEFTPGVFGLVEAVRESDAAPIQWRVHLDVPAHEADPAVRQACRDVISELRSLTGC